MNTCLSSLDLKTAIVHDWLPVIGGAERVLAEMLACVSNADVFTVFNFLSEREQTEAFGQTPIHASALNRLPTVEHYYRNLLLTAARAIEQFDVSKYDLVLSSSTALAKGVVTHSRQHHIAYLHSTTRYAWDLTHDYMATINGPFAAIRRLVAHEIMHRYRIWDMRTAASVDHFIANSRFTRDRIWKFYRRDAEVIYPPVDVDRFCLSASPRKDFYLTLSRLVPYKQTALIVEAFARSPERKLIVVGDGPDLKRLQAQCPPNVKLLGYQPEPVVTELLQSCRAFVFAALDDFGIAPVETQACGTPVIALNAGGTAETIRGLDQSNPTGVFYQHQTTSDMINAIDRFEEASADILPSFCRAQAERFSAQTFRHALVDHINTLISTPPMRERNPS